LIPKRKVPVDVFTSSMQDHDISCVYITQVPVFLSL